MSVIGTAIIVGFGPGVGSGVAEALAALGYPLALIARDAAKLQAAVANYSARGWRAQGFSADAADEASLTSAIATAILALGEPDVLVYNAACWRPGPVLDLSPAALVDDFRIGVAGALAATRAVAPGMIARGHGSILFTGGGLALYPSPQAPSLSIGKGGIRALALMLATELESRNVRVGTVTIAGTVAPDTGTSPQKIGEAFVALHRSAVDANTAEIVLKP